MSMRLLAKSYEQKRHGTVPPDYALLGRHTSDVVAACDALAVTVGRNALVNAGVSLDRFDRFRLLLKINGWIQDLGKANSHFQLMVTSEPQITQLVRHETLSAILVMLEPRMKQWLSPHAEGLLASVWGAAGHHRKFDERTLPQQASPMTLYAAHSDFASILADMSTDLMLSPPPVFDRDLVVARTRKESCDLPALESIRELQDMFEDRESEFHSETQRRMLALLKAFGIAADVAASAVAARHRGSWEYSLAAYIQESLKVGLTPENLTQLITNWAWSRSEVDRPTYGSGCFPPGFRVREFQDKVACSSSFLTLAQAGCGSGKSLAAYLWARRWCERYQDDDRRNFRLFVCLPTTGTTTEHFKDYALESGIDASLTHSRSSVDLQAMAETAAQEEAPETNDGATLV